MSKQISIAINHKYFNLSVDDNFAEFLQNTASTDLSLSGNNDIKTVLEGYIRAKYDLYICEKKIAQMLKNLKQTV